MDVIYLVFGGSSWATMLGLMAASTLLMASYIFSLSRAFRHPKVAAISLLAWVPLWFLCVGRIDSNYDAAVAMGAPYDGEYLISAIVVALLLNIVAAAMVQPLFHRVHDSFRNQQAHPVA